MHLVTGQSQLAGRDERAGDSVRRSRLVGAEMCRPEQGADAGRQTRETGTSAFLFCLDIIICESVVTFYCFLLNNMWIPGTD